MSDGSKFSRRCFALNSTPNSVQHHSNKQDSRLPMSPFVYLDNIAKVAIWRLWQQRILNQARKFNQQYKVCVCKSDFVRGGIPSFRHEMESSKSSGQRSRRMGLSTAAPILCFRLPAPQPVAEIWTIRNQTPPRRPPRATGAWIFAHKDAQC